MEGDQPKQSLVRPIIVGVAGGITSGVDILKNKLLELVKDYNVTVISLDFYKRNIDSSIIPIKEDEKEEYYRESPEGYDFDLMAEHIEKLKNGENVEFVNGEGKKISIESESIIVIEGVLIFYNTKIRSIIDIKLFIDVSIDTLLMNYITTGLSRGEKLDKLIENFTKKKKPIYVKYLFPTKKHADVILPQIFEHSAFIKILAVYLTSQMKKLKGGDLHYVFTSDNEVVDPKWRFEEDKILVIKGREICILKQAFIDVLTKEEDDFIMNKLHEKFIYLLITNLIEYFRKKQINRGSLPKVDLILTESDDYMKYNWSKYRKVIYFKTAIMSKNDLDPVKYILSQSPKCKLFINSIFLAPKHAFSILDKKMDNILFNTLYFSDFITKFEVIVKNNKVTYGTEILTKQFKEAAIRNFSGDDEDSQEDDEDDVYCLKG
ncbi:MAG: hypothetical protein MJ252_05355 [archaeon]|nr:hypothetical protein [archaeon]